MNDEIIIHILWGGRPYCGFSPEIPGNWPSNHRWVGPEESNSANCPGCVTLEILARHKAVITNSHIVYKSFKHGHTYINKDGIYPYPSDVSRLCRMMAEQFIGYCVDIVVGPVVGGVPLSQWTAYHLAELTGREILAVFADKEGDGFVIKRGYDRLLQGRSVAIVEDIFTTGGSAKQTAEAVRVAGGEVIVVGGICNRGGVTAEDLGVPELIALADVRLEMWEESECSLCRDGVPINLDVGHGKDFLARKSTQHV